MPLFSHPLIFMLLGTALENK